MRNVTPQPAGPRPVTTPNPAARRNQIIILAVFVIVLVLLVRACAGGENRYEKIQLDPDGKVFHFAYDRPQRGK